MYHKAKTITYSSPSPSQVKIRVKFLRNPYFDDHFDLTDPNHIVGKTLAWASPLVGGLVGRNCEVLGWALYNKWQELEAALDRLRRGKEHIAVSVVSCWWILFFPDFFSFGLCVFCE